MVSDCRESIYWTRATDADERPLDGRGNYTIKCPRGERPPLRDELGGFWSLTMYSSELFMLTDPPNGRVNIGTVHLRADQLKFNEDESLTLFLGSAEPPNEICKANWLPAPEGGFALCLRNYSPKDALMDGSYKPPNVVRGG